MLDIKLIFDIKDIDQLGNLPKKKKTYMHVAQKIWDIGPQWDFLIDYSKGVVLRQLRLFRTPPPLPPTKKKKKANSLNKCITGIGSLFIVK